MEMPACGRGDTGDGPGGAGVDPLAAAPVAMLLLATLVQGKALFPALGAIAPWLPAACSCVYGACFLLLSAVAGRISHIEGRRSVRAVMLAALAVSCVAWVMALLTRGAYPVLFAYLMVSVPRAFANSVALVGLARRPAASAFLTVAGAMVVAYFAAVLAGELFFGAAVVLYLALTAGGLLLSCKMVPTAEMRAKSLPPFELAAVNPFSFPEATGRLLGSIIVFETVFGVSTSIFNAEMAVSTPALCGVGVLALLLVCSRGARVHSLDRVFSACAILVVAALACSLGQIGREFGVPYVAGTVGSQVFYVETWTLLAAIGRRNPSGDMLAATRGLALSASAAAVGVCLAWAESLLPGLGSRTQALCLVGFVAYLWFGMRCYSLDDAVCAIEPVGSVVSQAGDKPVKVAQDESTVLQKISAGFGLTQRESEVFELLARGRNAAHIMETLHISRSTVKTHVRHIYQKLDVHTQQELIDLVERACR